MPAPSIGSNLRRLRMARRLSQERLASEAGLARSAYRKIESGASRPRVGTLQALARALGVDLRELLEPVPELHAVRFRSKKKLRCREDVLARVGRWLGDFNELEELLGERLPWKLADLAGEASHARLSPEETARLARNELELSELGPVHDICGLLEDSGVKLLSMRLASDGFFGLSVSPRDGGPAVVVNTWERIPVERWIFSAAHELGHLLLHADSYDSREVAEPDGQEREANDFASFFLMPEEAFWSEWEETYGLPLLDRVLKVKRIFRVSYRTVLHRLSQRGVYRGNIWARFQLDYERRYGRRLLRADEPEALARDAFRASYPEIRRSDEPERLAPADFEEDRLARLVRRAVEEGRISLGRGAEILDRSVGEMRELASSWVG